MGDMADFCLEQEMKAIMLRDEYCPNCKHFVKEICVKGYYWCDYEYYEPKKKIKKE